MISTETYDLPGRLVGMNVKVGTEGSREDAFLALSLNYNSCMCSSSSYIRQAELNPMTIVAVTGAEIR